MIFFTNILAVLAVILPYARNVVAASDDEMAVLCFDELGAFPYIDVCFFKPGASDAGQCKPLDHLFDGIDCTGPPDLKFGPTRISVSQLYTCYLFKSADCSGDYEQYQGGLDMHNVTADYWGIRCDSAS